ncbi:diguanylate cyclase [Trichocoleus sp. FACHB-591]|uniref:GGDEF domain-containing protein n=1 Tax=Trichocoleus sp. FACHB-591 TaxID=2692872 RepID=UPI001681C783|nr:diguanylate cyclase [Trichocoleus sp. FACHB-591]MBD2098610.1 diguanylate cyclase [Trichocoleus sp. FACHB-591]
MSSASHSRLLPLLSDICGRNLKLESTLAELTLYDFAVESHQPGEEVAQAFHQNPLLPGVILMEAGRFVGMISRRRFLEHLSRPYGSELFLRRPLRALYRFTGEDFLMFSSDVAIVVAARQALQRSPELLAEPILVHFQPHTYKLLDVHQLLVAQSQVHELATQMLNKLYQRLEVTNQELYRLVVLDSVTQVANRRHFDEYLAQEWWRMARERSPLSLILCDIDCFKAYNDTYGHCEGDRCLRQVAQALSQAVKRPADLVARYGGEEFVVVLPNTGAEGAVRVAEAIRLSIKDLGIPHVNSSIGDRLTLSLGVSSTIPNPEISPEELVVAADKALYHAKTAGRDRTILNLSLGKI